MNGPKATLLSSKIRRAADSSPLFRGRHMPEPAMRAMVCVSFPRLGSQALERFFRGPPAGKAEFACLARSAAKAVEAGNSAATQPTTASSTPRHARACPRTFFRRERRSRWRLAMRREPRYRCSTWVFRQRSQPSPGRRAAGKEVLGHALWPGNGEWDRRARFMVAALSASWRSSTAR